MVIFDKRVRLSDRESAVCLLLGLLYLALTAAKEALLVPALNRLL